MRQWSYIFKILEENNADLEFYTQWGYLLKATIKRGKGNPQANIWELKIFENYCKVYVWSKTYPEYISEYIKKSQYLSDKKTST